METRPERVSVGKGEAQGTAVFLGAPPPRAVERRMEGPLAVEGEAEKLRVMTEILGQQTAAGNVKLKLELHVSGDGGIAAAVGSIFVVLLWCWEAANVKVETGEPVIAEMQGAFLFLRCSRVASPTFTTKTTNTVSPFSSVGCS